MKDMQYVTISKADYDAMTGDDMAMYIERCGSLDALSNCLPHLLRLLRERDEAVGRLRAIVRSLASVIGIEREIESSAAFCNTTHRSGVHWDEIEELAAEEERQEVLSRAVMGDEE